MFFVVFTVVVVCLRFVDSEIMRETYTKHTKNLNQNKAVRDDETQATSFHSIGSIIDERKQH